MTKDEIISQVKAMNWPEGSYVVFGSCPMAVAGIRESSDIDLLVSDELAKQLQTDGWQQIEKSPTDKPFVRGDFEAHTTWSFSTYNPTLEELLSRADEVENVPFASLQDVLSWKRVGGREKDAKDVKLTEAYLAKTKE